MPAWMGAGWMSQGAFNSRPLDLMLLGLSWSQLSLDELEQREIVLEMDYILVLTDLDLSSANRAIFPRYP